MRNFCTLFDKNYLFKGLSLYRSLANECKDFMLHILCMDAITMDILSKMQLEKVAIISLEDFEDEELKRLKPGRSVAEYCWTCTPSLSLYVLSQNPEIDLITYLDSDIYFFSTPEPIFEELGDKSILIVEHRFAERHKCRVVNGIYNVEWVSFRRDANGLACLKRWREQCNEWCFNRLEDGRMGDQKYLDEWPERYAGVHVLQNIGGGVAPWNFERYAIEKMDGRVYVDKTPLVFYHFHQFRIFSFDQFFFMPDLYTVERDVPMEIYQPYVSAIRESIALVRQIAPGYKYGIDSYLPVLARNFARNYLPTSVKNGIKRLIRI